MASPSPSSSSQPNNANNGPVSIIKALGQAFKSQTGDNLSGDKIATLLLQNMPQLSELAKQGKLNQQQIQQLREYADKHKAAVQAPTPVFKTNNPSPFLGQAPANEAGYPISQTPPAVSSTGPQQWQASQQGRPTLTAGAPAGRIVGTPAQIKEDSNGYTFEETRSRRKNTPGDQSVRRTIQDLVASIDPNVKIEPEVEDLLLDVADEFIESVTNFGCRLAKHRGGDTLEVKDLQLHLERNHNIRIPGFASDDTRISMSQTAIAPATQPGGTTKKGTQSAQVTTRQQGIQQVQQAKRDAKLL